MTRLAAQLLATALGVGYAPIAPGTFGSAAGLALWAILPAVPLVQAMAIAALFAAGSWSGSVIERQTGRRDPGIVVIDEVMGMLIALFMNPVGWRGAFVAFLLFRAFDVLKPYPARQFERFAGGIGIMADDAMAGIYANVALRALLAVKLGNWVNG